MKVVTIIQARSTSSRLPNKALLDIYGKSLLERVIEQANLIRMSDELWVATSIHKNDDLIELLCERLSINCYRGSLEDVRNRFYEIAKKHHADIIVRVTADNPLTEPEYASQLISYLKEHSDVDYARIEKKHVVDGTNSEVFTMDALTRCVKEYSDEINREHVTAAMIEHMRMAELIPKNSDLIIEKSYFAGVDTFEDFKNVSMIFKKFGNEKTLVKLIKQLKIHEEAI